MILSPHALIRSGDTRSSHRSAKTIGILGDRHSFAKQFGARSQDSFAQRDSSNSQRPLMRILDMLSPEKRWPITAWHLRRLDIFRERSY